MDEKEKELRIQYHDHSIARLREIAASKGPSTREYHIATQMADEKIAKVAFLKSGIVAWISLCVAIISLIVSCSKKG